MFKILSLEERLKRAKDAILSGDETINKVFEDLEYRLSNIMKENGYTVARVTSASQNGMKVELKLRKDGLLIDRFEDEDYDRND
jgi:exosome complex RNA-binding protein Rrp4